MTPLIGREVELQELVDLVSSSSTRLLTLTGTGGVGKTRLAVAMERLEAVDLTKPGPSARTGFSSLPGPRSQR